MRREIAATDAHWLHGVHARRHAPAAGSYLFVLLYYRRGRLNLRSCTLPFLAITNYMGLENSQYISYTITVVYMNITLMNP